MDNQGGLVANTKQEIPLVFGADAPVTTAAPEQVHIASHVKSIFLNVQVAATGAGALANVYMIAYGNPANNIPLVDIPNGNVTGTSNFRKMIFHTEMLMVEKDTTGIPRTLFKGSLKIPRKFNRIGIDDKIAISLFAPGVNFDYCIQSIYKEIR